MIWNQHGYKRKVGTAWKLFPTFLMCEYLLPLSGNAVACRFTFETQQGSADTTSRDVTQVPAEGLTANHETNAQSALASPSIFSLSGNPHSVNILFFYFLDTLQGLPNGKTSPTLLWRRFIFIPLRQVPESFPEWIRGHRKFPVSWIHPAAMQTDGRLQSSRLRPFAPKCHAGG